MDAQPKLLDQVRLKIRMKHYSYRTEQQYVHWIRRFILHYDKRHPNTMGKEHIEEYLSHLASDRHVAAATQSQALAAILFVYRHVLNIDLPWLGDVTRAKQPKHLPVVLTPEETRAVFANLHDVYWLIASLLYGSGLRLLEALTLRVKDVDLAYRQLIVRDGKGHKDRVTVLPDAVIPALRVHLQRVREQHEFATAHGYGGVELPFALGRKYGGAHLELGWQYVFPATRPTRDPRSGTTQIYTHVMRKGAGGVISPLDGLTPRTAGSD
jgi:integron integrase